MVCTNLGGDGELGELSFAGRVDGGEWRRPGVGHLLWTRERDGGSVRNKHLSKQSDTQARHATHYTGLYSVFSGDLESNAVQHGLLILI